MRRHIRKSRRGEKGFTLIEMLIVAAILVILAAIAVPSYFDAQTRSRAARAMADMRSLATAIEAYRIDYGQFPIGTTDPNEMNPEVAAYMQNFAPGFHTFKVRGSNGELAGIHFATLSTPVSYLSRMSVDPFAAYTFESITPFAYWPATRTSAGWILTSVGPDRDLFAPGGVGHNDPSNPISTAAQSENPASLGDINESAAMDIFELAPGVTPEQRQRLIPYLLELSYDPTNGTYSEGDLYRNGGF